MFPAQPAARVNQGICPDLIWWMTFSHLVGIESPVLQDVLEGGEVGGARGPERDHIHSNFMCPVVMISGRVPEPAYHSNRALRPSPRSAFIGQGLSQHVVSDLLQHRPKTLGERRVVLEQSIVTKLVAKEGIGKQVDVFESVIARDEH